MAKRYSKNRRQNRHRRRTMKGGILSEEITNDSLNNSVEQDMNQSNFNNEDIEAIPYANDDIHNLDMGNDLNLNQSFESNGSLNIDDLNTSRMSGNTTLLPDESITSNQLFDSFSSQGSSQGSLHDSDLNTSGMSGYTTSGDESFGGKRRKRISKKRRGKKSRKTRKNRRTQRGGKCYGNGVGANSYDPNYSIYNTRELTLFPYRPTK
jgi:hypothetical protein